MLLIYSICFQYTHLSLCFFPIIFHPKIRVSLPLLLPGSLGPTPSSSRARKLQEDAPSKRMHAASRHNLPRGQTIAPVTSEYPLILYLPIIYQSIPRPSTIISVRYGQVMAPWLLDAIAAFGWVISVPKDWHRSWCDGSRSNIDTLQWLETAGLLQRVVIWLSFHYVVMFCDFLSTLNSLLPEIAAIGGKHWNGKAEKIWDKYIQIQPDTYHIFILIILEHSCHTGGSKSDTCLPRSTARAIFGDQQ